MASQSHDITWPVDDVVVGTEIENDTSLQMMAAKLENDVPLTPDTELTVDPSDPVPPDSDSSNSSSLGDNDKLCESYDDSVNPKPLIMIDKDNHRNGTTLVFNGTAEHLSPHVKAEVRGSTIKKPCEEKSKDSTDTESIKSKHGCSPFRKKNPLKMLKKLTKFHKPSNNSNFRSEFAVVTVDRLPQVFVVKYLGYREVTGVSGLHHVRKPLDEMVDKIKGKLDAKEELNLPLLYVIVSSRGLDLREHQSNKVSGKAPTGVIPLDLISYGVQDIKYWRVFTCIVVRAMSWQSKSATCHAFLCDSSHSGRKMALSLGAAFSMYSKKLTTDVTTRSFQVELRPPDELADGMQECDV